MNDLAPFLGHWLWFIIAGVLLFLELMAPGVFFIWLAAAAAVTGIADIVVPMPWQMEWLVFAALAFVSVLVGRSYLKSRKGGGSDQPNLNQRMYNYVGRSYVLDQPIVSGRGELTIEGTIWRIRGSDAPQGARVKVTGVDGMLLVVAPD